MSTPPEDENLLMRLRAMAFIRQGERAVGRAWFRSMTRFLDRVRPAVRQGGGVDPSRVSDHAGFWSDQVDAEIVPTVGAVLRRVARRVVPTPLPDSWTSDYLNDVGNRLRRIPDEVYGLIVAEVERGLRDGADIDTVSARIDAILTTSGSERWRNRAVTVARTETMGAVNAGLWRAAQIDADTRGDVAPFKVWLATDDNRTRPTHRSADGQRTLLTEPFVVGGARLLFPGDPRGPADEVINCRCVILPVVLGETLDWTDRQGSQRRP